MFNPLTPEARSQSAHMTMEQGKADTRNRLSIYFGWWHGQWRHGISPNSISPVAIGPFPSASSPPDDSTGAMASRRETVTSACKVQIDKRRELEGSFLHTQHLSSAAESVTDRFRDF